MNCCKKDNNVEATENLSIPDRGKNTKAKGHMSHMWMMVLCCGLPLALIFVLPMLGISFFNGALLGIIPFLCPLMMLLMIPMMMRGNRGSQGQPNNHDTRPVEIKKGG